MSTKIIRTAEVAPPTGSPLGSTVLDHFPAATVDGDFGLRNDAGLWSSYNGATTVTMLDLCVPDVITLDTVPWAPSVVFALQQGRKCGAVGLDRARMESETKRVFEVTEARGIEKMLDLALDTSFGTMLNVATPATGMSAPQQALALLESAAAARYAGQPTIHMSRFLASLLGEQIEWRDGKAYTRLGSKVVLGGGYDKSTPNGASEMYATGEVYIERSEQVDFAINTVPGDGSTVDPDGIGTKEVQTVTVTGSPTGGTFRLTYDGQQTATIAHNANAATVQSALEALSNLAPGDIIVTGGPGPATPWVVTFQAPGDVTQMTVSHTFTGGTTPNVAVTTTTAGVAAGPRLPVGDNMVVAVAERLYRVAVDPISPTAAVLHATVNVW